MILLVKLLLAHIAGDFLFQPYKWVENKERKKLKSPYLYVHILIHLVLLFLIVWDLSYWPLLLIIGVSHGIMDGIKLSFQSKNNKRFWFFADQAVHVLIIFLGYYIYTKTPFQLNVYPKEIILLIITCLVFLSKPVSIIMQVIFSKWNIEKLTEGNESLEDAGKYIGILERLLVFIFVITNHWEAVGFLITAKSVFRFGDLQESKQRKLTEYILIGTLISFGIAILTGLIFDYTISTIL